MIIDDKNEINDVNNQESEDIIEKIDEESSSVNQDETDNTTIDSDDIDNGEDFESDDIVETDEVVESEDKKETKKPVKYVKRSTMIFSIVVAVLLAIIIGTQACFVTINSIYDKKYQNFVNDYIEELKDKASKTSDTTSTVSEDNDIINAIRDLTKIIDNGYIYENEMYNKENIDALLKFYIENTGDKYSIYYTAEEWASATSETQGNGYGIGIYYNSYNYNEGLYVLHVMPDTPAYKAGIEDGDIIIKVDDIVVKDAYDEAVKLLKGEKGTSVNLVLLRDGEEVSLSVSRNDYTIQTVVANVIKENNKKVGHIRIIEFAQITASQFSDAVDKLVNEEKCDGLVFDLRDNTGGEVSSVVSMLDKLLPEGPILYFTDLEGNIERTYSSDSNEVSCKMVVLVNGLTASASEIFTSALRDYNKATIVGTHTYGKGCVLSGQYVTSTGGVVYYTSQLYKTAKSECFDNIGIEPDIVVESEFEENLFKLKYEDDVQLQKAVEVITK